MNDDDIIRFQNSVNKIKEKIPDYNQAQSIVANLESSLRPLHEFRKEQINNEILQVGQIMSEFSSRMSPIIDNSWIFHKEEIQNVLKSISQPIEKLSDEIKAIYDSEYFTSLDFGNYKLLYLPQNESNEDNIDEEANTKIIKEIYKPDRTEFTKNEESAIITLSPVNDKVLKYLSENPEAFYQLTGTDFEIVMAEIYSKLGYSVERTKSTRDGGKDIIIRKPEVLGDFIYYVECKKYSPKTNIGVGIIRNLIGTISTDKVNGGILATTSYFTSEAKKFIINHNYECQIKMHDYDTIRKLLDKAIR